MKGHATLRVVFEHLAVTSCCAGKLSCMIREGKRSGCSKLIKLPSVGKNEENASVTRRIRRASN